MVDVAEIFEHWYAGRAKVVIARSLGVDPQTVRKYTAAEAAGLAPGGPPVSAGQWRALAREWFPYLADTRLRQPAFRDIAPHHDRIAQLLDVVPVSVIWQRLRDEQGLAVSVASLRRYVAANFPDRAARAGLRLWAAAAASRGSPGRLRLPGAVERSSDRAPAPGVGVLDGAAVLAAPVGPPGDGDGPAGLDRVARSGVRVLRRGAGPASDRLCSAEHNRSSVPGCVMWLIEAVMVVSGVTVAIQAT